MTDRERLEKLLRSEKYLKQTTAGYTPSGPWWKRGMPLLWEVRKDLGNTKDGLALASAHGILKKTEKGYDPRAHRWAQAMELIDEVEKNLTKPPVPNLGPCIPGGKPVLLESPTHNTDGLFDDTGSYYPAFDFGWRAGVSVLAVEPMRVSAQSSSMGGDAFFATGESGIKYWIGHIVGAPRTGTKFMRGQVIGRIGAIPGVDHGHYGLDVRALIGRDLKWGRRGNGPDYTWGAPTIGQQLSAALAA